jgi:outer membrane protein OmpA-like peptidoglycan-associated protein
MKYSKIWVAGLIGTLPLVAGAEGPYISAASGANFSRDRELMNSNGQSVGQMNYDGGIPGALAAGYALANGWRGDVEFGFRRNDADSTTPGFTEATVDVGTMMAMLWFDWPVTWALRPYAGAGAGQAELDLESQNGGSPGQGDAVFAYQLATGVTSQLTSHVALSLDYRLLTTDEAQFGPSGLRSEYQSDAVMLGLRYSWDRKPGALFAKDDSTQTAGRGQAAAASEIAAFEVVLRPVNFKFDRDELTDPAKETLDELATKLAKAPDMKVTIDGHTDFIGSSDYNMALGERRANAVKDYLGGRGVNANVVEVRTFGESQPSDSNQTAEGRAVNRRAEVTTAAAPPQNVRVIVQPPTEASKEAAQGPEDPLANRPLPAEPQVDAGTPVDEGAGTNEAEEPQP